MLQSSTRLPSLGRANVHLYYRVINLSQAAAQVIGTGIALTSWFHMTQHYPSLNLDRHRK